MFKRILGSLSTELYKFQFDNMFIILCFTNDINDMEVYRKKNYGNSL